MGIRLSITLCILLVSHSLPLTPIVGTPSKFEAFRRLNSINTILQEKGQYLSKEMITQLSHTSNQYSMEAVRVYELLSDEDKAATEEYFTRLAATANKAAVVSPPMSHTEGRVEKKAPTKSSLKKVQEDAMKEAFSVLRDSRDALIRVRGMNVDDVNTEL
jgi:hypothetical protein